MRKIAKSEIVDCPYAKSKYQIVVYIFVFDDASIKPDALQCEISKDYDCHHECCSVKYPQLCR